MGVESADGSGLSCGHMGGNAAASWPLIVSDQVDLWFKVLRHCRRAESTVALKPGSSGTLDLHGHP
jgi:hypothetical protein